MTTEHTEGTEVATPETDKNCGWALTSHYGRAEGRYLQMDRNGPFVHVEFARKLERERDEWYHKAHVNGAFTFEARAERDEARELASGLAKQAERLRKERDEAREKLAHVTSAAQAVVDRWDLPAWKDAEPTAAVIYRLRDSLQEARP